jgi:hypothetical protein
MIVNKRGMSHPKSSPTVSKTSPRPQQQRVYKNVCCMPLNRESQDILFYGTTAKSNHGTVLFSLFF